MPRFGPSASRSIGLTVQDSALCSSVSWCAGMLDSSSCSSVCVVRSAAAAAVSRSWTPALLLHITSFWSTFFFKMTCLFSALSKSGLASLTCNEDIVPRYYLSCPTPDSLKLLGVKCMGEMLRADRTFILFYSCLRCCQRLRLLTINCGVE